ncbi:MAG: PAS domain-containing protein [Candidatus Margulisbacteria bacterium]|nr:PAS domain-containing protein [Candidatus Margulisiibacteriota bacterium]
MNHIFVLISFLGMIVGLVSGAVIMSRDNGARINRIFFVFALSVGSYCLFDMLTLLSNNDHIAKIFSELSLFFWLALITVIVPFCLEFASRKTKLISLGFFVYLYLLMAVVYLDYLYDLIYQAPYLTQWGYISMPGPYFWVLIVYSLLMIIWGLGLLILSAKQSASLRIKKQAGLLIWGIGVSTLIGLVDVIAPLFNSGLPSFTSLATITYMMYFSVAIIRYGALTPTPALLANNILDTMPGFLLFVDQFKKIKLVNKSFLEEFQYVKKEIIGQDCGLVCLDKIEHGAFHKELEEKGSVSKKKIVLNRKDGSLLPVRMDAAVVKDRAGEKIGEIYIFLDLKKEEELLQSQKKTIDELTRIKGRMLSLLEDTTQARDEAKRKSEELAKAVDDLKVVDRLKTQFLSVISHELRTPLTPIKGFSSMLMAGQLGQLTEKQVKAIESIKREGEHLQQLIDSILDVSWIERGHKMEIKKEPVAFSSLIKDLVANMEPQFMAEELSVEVDLQADLNTLVADRSRLYRLCSNIIGNAIKYSPRGGKIMVIARNTKDGIELRVIDNGIGIEKQYLEKIFDKFFQINNSYARTSGGVGLGLAISKTIVEAHGGSIRAESDGLGWGTAIVVNLPVGN